MFDRCEGEVEGFCGPAVIFEAEVKDARAEGDRLGGFNGSLDFVHGKDAFGLVAGDEIEGWLRVSGPIGFFGLGEDGHVHGGCDGVGAEPVAEFANSVSVGVVEVMTRGEDLNGFGTGLVQRVEMAGAEAVCQEDMGGDAEGHGFYGSACGGWLLVVSAW